MSHEVTLPILGESALEGTICRWLKKVGDPVSQNEPLLEVSTDKVDLTIPSPVSGVVIAIMAHEDETVTTGDVIAIIGQPATSPVKDHPVEDNSVGGHPVETRPVGGSTMEGSVAEDRALSGGVSPTTPARNTDAMSAPPQPAAPTVPVPQPAVPVPQPAVPVPPAVPAPVVPTAPQPTAPASPTPPQPAARQPEGPTAPQVAEPAVPTMPAAPTAPAVQAPTVATPTPDQSPAAPAAQVPPMATQVPAPETQVPPTETATSTAPVAPSDTDTPTSNDDASDTVGYVTPLVRKLAAEAGIDLDTVSGSGVGGRIRKQDILQAASQSDAESGAAPQPATQPPAAQLPEPVQPPATDQSPLDAAPLASSGDQPAPQSIPAESPADQPAPIANQLDPLVAPAPASSAPEVTTGEIDDAVHQGDTADHSVAPSTLSPQPLTPDATQAPDSTPQPDAVPGDDLKTSSPASSVLSQVTATVEVDLTRVARLRAQAEQSFFNREGQHLTYLPFVAAATITPLRQYPRFNATIAPDGTLTPITGENLAITVDTDHGPCSPVIKDAGDLSVTGLAKQILAATNRARANQVSPDELADGTFTLTDDSSNGTLFTTPSLIAPQVAALGLGSVTRRPIVVEDATLGEIVAIRPVMFLSLSYDNRHLSQSEAARFLGSLKAGLEGRDLLTHEE